MPLKSTSDVNFVVRTLMETYRESQKSLHCVFVELDKSNDRMP